MPSQYILAIDQGTTGTRAFVFDALGHPRGSAYREIRQYFPKPGWVEHDPLEIWNSVLKVSQGALAKAGISSTRLAAIGITNQRETSILWDAQTGQPCHRAIVWQDRRTASITEALKKSGKEYLIRFKTGLVSDPYFSASKIQWLFRHVPAVKQKAALGRLLFGTMDTWLVWKLTGGRSHVTDFTNASRTLLLNIRTHRWDPELLRLFKVPRAVLPRVMPSGSEFGQTAACGPLKAGIPILSILGDQQASLYGQACYEPGAVKNTIGTGAFLMMNIGKKYCKPPFGLLTTLACDRNGKPVYALEGANFIAGAALQWLRDGLRILTHATQSESLARSVPDSDGVIFIPALVGLGSPYWAPQVRGAFLGLTRGTRREHMIRATLEALAHQTADVVELMKKKSGYPVRALKIDGGANRNNFLMQTMADYLGLPISAPALGDSTAWGAAKLAGHMAGLWPDLKKLDARQKSLLFKPGKPVNMIKTQRQFWKRAVSLLIQSAR